MIYKFIYVNMVSDNDHICKNKPAKEAHKMIKKIDEVENAEREAAILLNQAVSLSQRICFLKTLRTTCLSCQNM